MHRLDLCVCVVVVSYVCVCAVVSYVKPQPEIPHSRIGCRQHRGMGANLIYAAKLAGSCRSTVQLQSCSSRMWARPLASVAKSTATCSSSNGLPARISVSLIQMEGAPVISYEAAIYFLRQLMYCPF
jgi:hypothetical protein